MKILSQWLREYVPGLTVSDRRLAEDLTLRGIAVEGIFDLGLDNGLLFDMDITTNRVDAMNHYGIAREVAAIYNLPLSPLQIDLPEARPGQPFPVSIEEPALCGRFTARVLRDVHIVPSNGTIAERFRLLEQKAISNAVDATNFTTLAIGQPTHVFDLDKLQGGIIVRKARKGEKLRTLDGVERTLDADDLVIADEARALGIAGVMGGWDTMITAETRNILVEAAWFDPGTVRRSSKRHGLHTDASHRFERGADFNAPPIANALVSSIVLEAGGYIEDPLTDVAIEAARAGTANRSSISLAVREVRRILGTTEDTAGITADAVQSVLTALGCGLRQKAEGEYDVTLPSWRLDLEREIDLIEEVARVYGYNGFANTLPSFAGTVVALPWAQKELTLRSTLIALGWNEAISSTFCSAAEAAIFEPQPGTSVALGNPLSEEAGVLRSSLLSGMLTMLALNLNRDSDDASLFEMGTVFHGNTDRVEERPSLAIGATGRLPVIGPHEPARDVNFYDMKGSVEELLSKFSARSMYFDAFPVDSGLLPAWLHPGRAARAVLDGLTIGYFGELHPSEAQRRKLKQTILIGEFDLARLYAQPLRQPDLRELSRFQAVRRDFSILFPETIRYAEIEAAMRALEIPEMISFGPKEVLRDAKGKLVPPGQVSYLIGTVFQSPDRTLREEELQVFSQRILAALETLGGRLRS
jgi:phenylalanyl-tRNA synthetase beta chain